MKKKPSCPSSIDACTRTINPAYDAGPKDLVAGPGVCDNEGGCEEGGAFKLDILHVSTAFYSARTNDMRYVMTAHVLPC